MLIVRKPEVEKQNLKVISKLICFVMIVITYARRIERVDAQYPSKKSSNL